MAVAGIALWCAAGCHPATATPPAATPNRPLPGLRGVNWCDHAFPWPDGFPVREVKLGPHCSATYQEAMIELPGDLATWSWRLEKVDYDERRDVAGVTLEMRQTIGGKSSTQRRGYTYRWDGRAPVLVASDWVLPLDPLF
jgi:hypothetical protein